jgi:PIN domain nuclease of toxin-antitoxin system
MANGVLLDTHVLHWWWCRPVLLSRSVRHRLTDGDQTVVVSAVSWLELSVALESSAPAGGMAELLRRFPGTLAEEGFSFLPLQLCHLERAARLGGPSDGLPGWIDRLLVAQARQEGLQLISLDPALEPLGEPLVW